MRDLPLALRVYLWALYLICPIFVVSQIAAIITSGAIGHPPVVAIETAAAFLVLTYLGERFMLQVSSAMSQSLATTAQVAAILLLPWPAPMLIALIAVATSQVHVAKPLYRRAYNVCHTTLAVGVSNLLCSIVARPLVVVEHGSLVSTVLHLHGTDVAVLALLVIFYYLCDAGMMTPVLALADGCSFYQAWRQRQVPSLLPELAASTIGILTAVAWSYGPILVTLIILPVLALRVAFRAIMQAEERAVAMRRHSEQLEAVLAVGEQLQLQQTQAELLGPVAESAREIAGATAVAAYLRDPDEPSLLERVVLVPPDASDIGPSRLPAPMSDSRTQVMSVGDGVWLIPLQRDGARATGLLRLVGVADSLGDNDCDALAILATQATIALQNAQLHERALAQASEDGLTSLLNHRAFQTRLDEEVHRAQRSGSSLAVMMVDLDNFGAINNMYGHQAGDTTLQVIAAAVRGNIRASDIAARYGGDEFAVILPETTVDEALTVAERVRIAIAGLTIEVSSGPVRVGASIGVAALPLHAEQRADLVRAADQAAYVAKHAGKGRVCRPEDALLSVSHDPATLAVQLEHANLATVEALAAAVDAKDPYTRGHAQRVSAYAEAIAVAMRLSAADIVRVRLAGLLHDVGKIGVPDSILSKPGKLTDEEFDLLKKHPVIGEGMLKAVPYLREILPAVRHHHERWDGRGYPDGLAGSEIPQDAAILMVADSFDAMTSTRVYRPALPLSEACRRIREGSETQFNPDVVDAFEHAYAHGAIMRTVTTGRDGLDDEQLDLAC